MTTSAVPLRGRVRRAALLLPLLATFSGCAGPAQTILTSANGYHWHRSRYSETCAVVTDECRERAAVLARWYTALGEANDALQRGGKLPLQLESLKKVEKEAKQWTR